MITIECNKGVISIILIIAALSVAYLYSHFHVNESKVKVMQNDHIKSSEFVRQTETNSATWLAHSGLVVPPSVDVASVTLKVISQNIEYDNKVVTIHALRGEAVGTSKGDLLLLHGAHFTSDTWNGRDNPSLLTIKTMASLGYKTVAIDLPGYGKSASAPIPERGDFLARVIKALKLERPVVVSPSMSGSFAVPFVMKHGDMCRGFVPVAPVGTNQFSNDQFLALKVPTLVLYGELDTHASSSTNRLRLIPHSEVYMLRQAKHPAYLDQPAAFHLLLYNFLLAI